jgi:hypothetical protein
MTAIFWLGVVGLVIFVLLAINLIIVGMKLFSELTAIHATLDKMLGSIAESNWRVRDELAKCKEKPN